MSKSIMFSLIGKETTPNYRAYKEFTPQVLVHVYSDYTQKESDILKSMIDSRTTKLELVKADGESFNDVYSKLKHLNLDVQLNDYITINVTGGTKMMALALIEYVKQLNCNNISYFYIDRKQNIQWYLENRAEDFCESLELEEFIQLAGQKIKSKDRFLDLQFKFDQAIDEINTVFKDFNGRKQWDKFSESVLKPIRRKYDELQNTGKSLISIFNDWNSNFNTSKFEINWCQNKFTVSIGEELWLELDHSISDVEWFIFNAGWFELQTAIRLAKKHDPSQIFMNVKFPLLKKIELDKNEVDILINDGGKLIFIECKSGIVKSDHINTIDVRKKTYGGLISQSILITRFDLERDSHNSSKIILEKCKDLDIKVLSYNKL